MLDLGPIKEREEKATAGPWRRSPLIDGALYTVARCRVCESDMDFISHARNDIPALVAEVERLRAELKEERDGRA